MLNHAILMGRLTADPELRYTPSNKPVTSFRLAVDRNFIRQGAERETDFITIVAWNKTAEFVARYFHKGQLMAVAGSLQTRPYTDKNQNKRTATEIVASHVYFADAKTAPAPISQGVDIENDTLEEIEGDADLPF